MNTTPAPNIPPDIMQQQLEAQNAQLRQEIIDLRRAQAELEQQLACSTAAVAQANASLKAEIAARKQAEEQLRQAQKMEVIGRLASGIAHDFNNLLTVILGNVELLLAASTDVQALRKDAEQIQQAAEQAAALTRQLMTFSRQQALEPRPLDLNTVVANMIQLLRRLIGEDIELVTRLAPDLGPVHADPGQIEQVIMNLAANARDAMPAGGTLKLTTANVAVHDAHECAQVGVEQGCYILLTISDTGVGMDAATYARILEPFSTTKAPGKGTGLGLTTVHGIVSRSGGRIVVDSEPSQGTVFKIYLPRVDADDGKPPQCISKQPMCTPLPSQRERGRGEGHRY